MVSLNPLKDEVLSAIEKALGSPMLAEVRIKEPGTGGADFDVDVMPQGDGSAPIWITVAGGDIDVVLGQGSRLALVVSSQSPSSALHQLAEVVTAVAAGRFRETFQRRGDQVIAAYGELELRDGPMVLRSNTFRKPRRDATTVSYDSYTRAE